MHARLTRRIARALPWLGTLLLSCAALAQEAADPPGRAAFVSQRQGSVVYAPQGEEEWQDLPPNRPLAHGDRLWTDKGARAELQLGTATLHVDSETHLGISDLDENAAQFMLQQGTVNARVRDVAPGENFEIGTPNVAFRALQAGDYRIDVDAVNQQTRIVVHSGMVAVFGEGGQSINLGTSQQAVFAGRFLAQISAQVYHQDEFHRWAAERNRAEDQAVATRYVPRGVVGASQLDGHGTWTQDVTYGTVWYPNVTVANWAPYRHGHWSWIPPWGWTWIDDAAWGFAPFHYGRWTMIGPRWAWVPGRMPARPVYSPAMVVFLGGGGGYFNISTGPAVGWYPLAPGEAWWPWYRTSPRYVGRANYTINLDAWPRHATHHHWRSRPLAITAVREDDFRRGRAVNRSWQPVSSGMVDRAQVGVTPARPQGRYWRDNDGGGSRPVQGAPSPRWSGGQPPVSWGAVPPAVREQQRAQQEQDRIQRRAERDAREQIREANDPRAQQEAWQRQQRNAGRVDIPGQNPRDAGRVDMNSGAEIRRPDQGAPRHYRQVQPIQQQAPVPVPRQQAVPIVREERWQQRQGGGYGGGRFESQARDAGRWQHQRAAPEIRGPQGGDGGGRWNRGGDGHHRGRGRD